MAGIDAIAEVLALEHLLECDLGVELENFLVGHFAKPIAVVDDFGFRLVEDLKGLVGVGLGIGEDLVAGERRASGRAAGGVADGGGEIADQQHRLVAEFLELAKLFERDRVAEVNVGCGGVDAELHTQRPAEAEFFQQFFFRKDLGAAFREGGKLLLGTHDEKIAGSAEIDLSKAAANQLLLLRCSLRMRLSSSDACRLLGTL